MCIFHTGTDDLDRPIRCLYWVYLHTFIYIIFVNLKLRHLFGPRALSLNACLSSFPSSMVCPPFSWFSKAPLGSPLSLPRACFLKNYLRLFLFEAEPGYAAQRQAGLELTL